MKRFVILKLIAFLTFSLNVAAEARPISYKGGWTAMQRNDGESNSLHLHYTPDKQYSIGYKGVYMRDEEFQFHGAQLNYLLKRWNGDDYQANFYFKNAMGFAYSDHEEFDGKTSLAGFTSLDFDWENRRFFTSYGARGDFWGSVDGESFHQRARVGIAPYIAEFGELHTWIMIQFDHHPEDEDQTSWTPLVRFFKGPIMIELGYSDNEKVLANAIYRF